MPKSTAPPRHLWDALKTGGREFVVFPLTLRQERQVRCTMPRRIAGRYEVLDVLARGGGGVILVCDDVRTGHRVLVKALADYDTSRQDLKEPIEEIVESIRRARHHLQTERRLLVHLRNAGCAAVPHVDDYAFDANPGLAGPFETESRELWRLDDRDLIESEPFLVMQRVPGTNLQDLLETTYPEGIDERSALRIVDQAAAVLELLHRPWTLAGGRRWEVVYQDLKPGNLLVDETGRTTLLDFGGCRIVIDGELVLRGSYTPGYCAPECGDGDHEVTVAADCYSLGTTLYHLLTGRNPRSLLPAQIERGATKAVRLDVQPLRGECSPAVVAFLERCVAWDRELRFRTVVELRAALAGIA